MPKPATTLARALPVLALPCRPARRVHDGTEFPRARLGLADLLVHRRRRPQRRRAQHAGGGPGECRLVVAVRRPDPDRAGTPGGGGQPRRADRDRAARRIACRAGSPAPGAIRCSTPTAPTSARSRATTASSRRSPPWPPARPAATARSAGGPKTPANFHPFDIYQYGFDASWEPDIWGQVQPRDGSRRRHSARLGRARRGVLLTALAGGGARLHRPARHPGAAAHRARKSRAPRGRA